MAFEQRDLIDSQKTAHNAARKNMADKGYAETPVSKPQPIEGDMHPFGGNPNNMRVAQRLAATPSQIKKTDPPKTPQQAAKDDLAQAAAFEEEHPDAALSTQEEADLEATAPTVLQPLTPAQKAAQTRAEKAAAVPASTAQTDGAPTNLGGAPPLPGTGAEGTGSAPTFKG